MAELHRKTTRYRLPIFCEAGVSHYVPTTVKWEYIILDDGFQMLEIADIFLTEMYGEA